MRCSLNPPGAEEKLVGPLRVDEVAVAGGDPGRPLGLNEQPDEGGEADKPAAYPSCCGRASSSD